METFAEDAELVGGLRTLLWERGEWKSVVVPGKEAEGVKYSDYFAATEQVKLVPSHRTLALLRGRKEGFLRLSVALPGEGVDGPTEPERRIAGRANIENKGRPGDKWLAETVRWTWKVKLLDTATIYPHEPREDWAGSLRTLGALAAKHSVQLISIGNGTASRETDKLAADPIKALPNLPLTKVMVSEAGASVDSASELAAKEFPDLDVSLRGAVSIARRLQDPLAELVRIDPKAIGVGQYQHDVSPFQLGRTLNAVVEDCVNAVGADLNTASVPLLARISGLSDALAGNIVSFRDANGPFRNRKQLLKVPRVGERTFQQAAGFLRVMNGDNPLDASAVHPEAYPVVERIAVQTGLAVSELIGKSPVLRTLKPEDFADAQFGVPTVKDILAELDKPNRDPRPEFRTAAFKDGVQDLREVVKAGDIVKVRVVEVDAARKRIALTMKSGVVQGGAKPAAGPRPAPQPQPQSKPKPAAVANTALGAAFAKLGQK